MSNDKSVFANARHTINVALNTTTLAFDAAGKLVEAVDVGADIVLNTAKYARDANLLWIHEGVSELSPAQCAAIGIDYIPLPAPATKVA